MSKDAYRSEHFISSHYPFSVSVVRDVHSLVIRSVCHAHGGVYKSVISNKVGKATCYAHLYVTGKVHYLLCHILVKAPVCQNYTISALVVR